MKPSQEGVIAQIPDIPLLHSLGLRTGKLCRFVTRHPFKGPVIVLVGGRQIAIDRATASSILIEPAS